MRIAAISLNFLLLVMVLFLFATDGAPEGEAWLFVILIIAASICNLIVLFGARGETWLSLYFKRKTLEEKKKINQLSKKNDN
jgi:uncharacterized membrane protein YbhN (UPF0104 family)